MAIGEDISTTTPTALLVSSLKAKAKLKGFNYDISIGRWKEPRNTLDKASIVISPVRSETIHPIDPGPSVVETTQTTLTCAFWALTDDNVETLRSWFRSTSKEILLGWVEFGSVVYDKDPQMQHGKLIKWSVDIKTQLMRVISTEGTALINTVIGASDAPPYI